MKESAYNTILNAYLRSTRLYCYYELKVVKGHTFQFSKIEKNQHEGLLALAHEGLIWKLSDEDRRKKPCDGFCTPPLPAYLILVFKQRFHFVPYERIATMIEEEKKSITQLEAFVLCHKAVYIGAT